MTREETAKSVCFKLIVKYTKDLEAQNCLATYIHLRDRCWKTADDTISYFDWCFKEALKQELIFEVNGLYTTKRPGKYRTLDDNWNT